MKATGVVRRMDELGRVVIPKEYRRIKRLRDGDEIEIVIDENGELVLRKYSSVNELSFLMQSYSLVLHQSTNRPILIADSDRVIACAGIPLDECADHLVRRDIDSVFQNGTGFTAAPDKNRVFPLEDLAFEAALIFPIQGPGNSANAGYVIMLMDENGSKPTQTEVKLVEVAASFLGQQIEA